MSASAATHVTVRVALSIRRPPGRKTVVTPVGTSGQAATRAIVHHADPALVKALSRAFRYQRLLDEGRYASITEMADAEQIERGYLGTLLRLTLLMPDLVEAILNGRASHNITLPNLLMALPEAWVRQGEQLMRS